MEESKTTEVKQVVDTKSENTFGNRSDAFLIGN